jgi:hypothetical protein
MCAPPPLVATAFRLSDGESLVGWGAGWLLLSREGSSAGRTRHLKDCGGYSSPNPSNSHGGGFAEARGPVIHFASDDFRSRPLGPPGSAIASASAVAASPGRNACKSPTWISPGNARGNETEVELVDSLSKQEARRSARSRSSRGLRDRSYCETPSSISGPLRASASVSSESTRNGASVSRTAAGIGSLALVVRLTKT